MGYMQGFAGKKKAFNTEAIEIDFDKRLAICPAGHQNSSSSVRKTGTVYLYFDSKTCQRCKSFGRLVRDTNKSATKRQLKLRPLYQYMGERRLTQEEQ
jgi:hypothetical protein